MKSKIIISLAFLLLSQLSWGQDSLQYYLKKADKEFANKEFVPSMNTYKNALKQDVKSYEAIMGVANSMHKLDLFKPAIQWYDKAEEIKDTDSELYFNRGAAKVFIEDYKNAIKDFDKSIKLEDDSAKTYFYRGNCYTYLDHYRKALSDYNKAVELKSDYAAAIYNRGAAKGELGDYEAGMVDFDYALKKDPTLGNGRINLALSLLGLKRYQEAIDLFSEVIDKRDDNLSKAYFYRAEAEYEIKRQDEACADWFKAGNLGYEQGKMNANTYCDKESNKKKKGIKIIF